MEQVLTIGRQASRSAKIALFCLLYAAGAAIAFPDTFLRILAAYPLRGLLLAIAALLGTGLFVAAFWNRPRSPLTFIRDKIADRGMGFTIIVVVFFLAATATTTIKHEFGHLVSFYADPAIANIDELLHFGTAPWQWARMALPAALDQPLFYLYSAVWFLQMVATAIYAAWIADRAARERYFETLALSAVFLSAIVRLAGSSAGPVFYDRLFEGGRFADLMTTLAASDGGARMLKVTDYLFTAYVTNTPVLGSGISAMPSLHVAFSFLNALFVWSRHPIAGCFAWAYAASVLFGSVYFGWHYALDGYVSILFVLLFWRLAAPRPSPAS